MSRVTISLEHQLARQLDKLVIEGGYANRSAAVREMIRFGLDRADLLGMAVAADGDACIGHVSFVCGQRDTALVIRLHALLHAHKALVRSSHRTPVDDEHVLEVLVLAGAAGAVKACAEHAVGLRGASHGSIRIQPVGATVRAPTNDQRAMRPVPANGVFGSAEAARD